MSTDRAPRTHTSAPRSAFPSTIVMGAAWALPVIAAATATPTPTPTQQKMPPAEENDVTSRSRPEAASSGSTQARHPGYRRP